MDDSDSTKRCNKCDAEKPLSDFYFRENGKPRGNCIACDKAQKAMHRAANRERLRIKEAERRANEPDKVKAEKRAYYAANREEICRRRREHYKANRELRIRQNRESVLRNSESVAARRKAHYEANRERYAAWSKAWWKRNPDKARIYYTRRKARKNGAGGYHTAEDVRNKYAAQNGRCYWCMEELDKSFHVDHIVPLAKGGSDNEANICCACPRCNLSKGDKMPWEFSDRLF